MLTGESCKITISLFSYLTKSSSDHDKFELNMQPQKSFITNNEWTILDLIFHSVSLSLPPFLAFLFFLHFSFLTLSFFPIFRAMTLFFRDGNLIQTTQYFTIARKFEMFQKPLFTSSLSVFSRMNATLEAAMSVGWSVGWLVGHVTFLKNRLHSHSKGS